MASENPDAVRWASTAPDGPGTVPVSGIVRDPAGRPVAGALVTAASLDRPPRPVPELAVFTDPAGRYDWPSLAPGRYEMRVTTTAGTATAAATVTPAATATANLRLRALTGPSPPVMPDPPCRPGPAICRLVCHPGFIARAAAGR